MIVGFGGVAFLGLVGFLYAWFSIRRTSQPGGRDSADQRRA